MKVFMIELYLSTDSLEDIDNKISKGRLKFPKMRHEEPSSSEVDEESRAKDQKV